MYYTYSRSEEGGRLHYDRGEKNTHLFGCNIGEIPRLLRQTIGGTDQGEPWKWHLALDEIVANGEVLVIDLKPNDPTRLNLYEIADVWGYSNWTWTPIMFRLRGLFVEQDKASIDPCHFACRKDEIEDPIFSFLFLAGSVQHGKLIGTWTAPRAAAANSVLLWPEVLEYFAREAWKFLPQSASIAPLPPLATAA